VQPAQVLGKEFVRAVLEHKWRLTVNQVTAKCITEEEKQDSTNSLVVRVMNNENPQTHGTIVTTAWTFYKCGGFDENMETCEDAGWDLAQRMKMVEKYSNLPRVLTADPIVGICLLNEPTRTRWAETVDDAVNKSADAAIESERLLKLGEFMRNGGADNFKSEKYSPPDGPARMSVQVSNETGPITEPRDTDDDAELTLWELSADLLKNKPSAWLRAQRKWDIVVWPADSVHPKDLLDAVEEFAPMKVAEPVAVAVSKHDCCEQLVEIAVMDNGFTNNQHDKYKQTIPISQIMICVGDDYWSLKARGSPQDHGPWAQGSRLMDGRVTNPP
jgi:hypothetical protein